MKRCWRIWVLLAAMAFMPLQRLAAQLSWEAMTQSCRDFSANYYDRDLCRLKMYMLRFPQSQLCDVYKYCFQDAFGLEHLLSDSMGAVRYIQYEIEHSDSADLQQPLFYYPLLNNNYVRVDINYVRQGIIPMDVMVSAMLESATKIDYDSAMWHSRWLGIARLLKGIEPQPLNYDEDYAAIEQLLSSGRYACHHSRLFNATYRQHYRIIRRDVFERSLLPLIEPKRQTIKQ